MSKQTVFFMTVGGFIVGALLGMPFGAANAKANMAEEMDVLREQNVALATTGFELIELAKTMEANEAALQEEVAALQYECPVSEEDLDAAQDEYAVLYEEYEATYGQLLEFQMHYAQQQTRRPKFHSPW
jgi:flagellar motility protein MotE (MotC chaperone)